MKIELKDYKPINYKNWILRDKARTGVNIKELGILTKKELEIFNESVPYQDQRDDPGQAELVTYFALKLLNYLPGEREVVVPAAILHDTGFFGGDPKAWKKLVNSGANTEGEVNRRPHQNRGCLISGRILEKVLYSKKYNNEIADIIGDHDTRKLPATESGEIVRAADLLWRVSFPCTQIYLPKASTLETLKKLEDTALGLPSPHTLGKIEKQIGKIELVNTMFFKFPNKAPELLKKNYNSELKTIMEFYNI
tara:strand:+ start:78 stop:833 length:756 start_codon:yes stop_codon:yes gene_type:complete